MAKARVLIAVFISSEWGVWFGSPVHISRGRLWREWIGNKWAYNYLPIFTGILASPAKTLGGFDLVRARLTNPYRFRACDGCSPLVGLVIITVLYHGAILARPRPWGHFTKAPPQPEGITHSSDTMCYVVLLWLYWCGDDRHLYDVGVLLVWTAIGVYECLGVSDGVEVARVLC